ncbi:zinc finger protein 638 isoform X5 [Sarcophilus harrisii]|nr:zinc finger protein 638 isoform X5 [Sarcophilus harrisii]
MRSLLNRGLLRKGVAGGPAERSPQRPPGGEPSLGRGKRAAGAGPCQLPGPRASYQGHARARLPAPQSDPPPPPPSPGSFYPRLLLPPIRLPALGPSPPLIGRRARRRRAPDAASGVGSVASSVSPGLRLGRVGGCEGPGRGAKMPQDGVAGGAPGHGQGALAAAAAAAASAAGVVGLGGGALLPSPALVASVAAPVPDPLRRFVLFLENFAPLVNSLNLGIANPLLLGPSPLQFAQIKTQLALQQLNAVASHGSASPYSLLNQSFLKIAMSRPRFTPRGHFPGQRPQAPNPSGMKPHGGYMRTETMGIPRLHPSGRPHGIAQRFGGHESYQSMGPHRTNVQMMQHRTDPRLAKEKMDFHEAQQKKGKPHVGQWDDSPRPSGTTGLKRGSATHITDQNPKVHSRYTKESASSILASFGLSNEDLEELSRYPDEQLTPENMPLILRDIRMRKMGRWLPNLPSQRSGKETLGGETVSSNVIDYGHASKYGYTEDPLEVRIYDPEEPTEENKNEFQSQQNISVSAPNVICNTMFPVEDLIRQMGFQSESSNNQSFFPVDSTNKMSNLSMTGQSVLEPVNSVSQSISQAMSQSLISSMSQSLIPPPMSQQSFSAELITPVSQQERISHEPVINSSNMHIGSGGGKKNYSSEPDAPIQSPFGIVKASWLPKFSQAGAQKMKRLPTPSMMNDYYAASPRIFPHMCSLCNVECSHLKNWIQHQNTPAHIESCRQLRQQYPDWNPEILSSRRDEGNRKENQTPRRRTHSSSASPRRSRAPSFGHKLRRSRSRSPGRYMQNRPRSRSPRCSHRFSPRHRSRSPHRSRNPLRGSPKPPRSASSEWTSRRRPRSPDKRSSLEAVVQSLGHGFPAEFSKQKHFEVGGKGRSSSQKILSSGSKPLCKNAGSAKSEPSSASHSARHKVKNPEDACSSQMLEESVPQRKAYLEMKFKEAVAAAVKYCETTPVQVKGKRVKISAAGKKKLPSTVQNKDGKKIVSETKKPSTSKKDTDASKAESVMAPSTGKSSVKKSMISASAKSNKTSNKSAKPSGKKTVESKKPIDPQIKDSNKTVTVPEKLIPLLTESDQPTKTLIDKENIEIRSISETKSIPESKAVEGTAKENASGITENEDSVSKETEEMCIVLISNLPNKGYSTEEVSNLAKPFGGFKDILILSSHKKAYMEINRKSADSMVKFYTCFPMSMDGNQLLINMAPENINLKDEEAIFTSLIKESSPEANLDTIHSHFVHLGNLPEDGYTEHEVVCVGLQFGKVDRYVFINNRNKVILQLDSPESAQKMHSFLKQNPFNLGENMLTCTLSLKTEPPEVETERDPEPGKESPDLKNNPVDESEVQTAADSSSFKPSEIKEETIPNSTFQTEPSTLQEETSKGEIQRGAVCDYDLAPGKVEVEKQVEETELKNPDGTSALAYTEVAQDSTENSIFTPQDNVVDLEKEADLSSGPSGGAGREERDNKQKVEEFFPETEDAHSVEKAGNALSGSVGVAAGDMELLETASEVVSPISPMVTIQGVYTGNEKLTVSKEGIYDKNTLEEDKVIEFKDIKTEPKAALEIGLEKEPDRNTAEDALGVEKPERIVIVTREKMAENTVIREHVNKGVSQASKPDETSKTSVQVVSNASCSKLSSRPGASTPNTLKTKVTGQKSEVKTEDQRTCSKLLPKSQASMDKKLMAKDMGSLRPAIARSSLGESSKSKASPSGVARGGSGRTSVPQDKDYRALAKQSQETETRPSAMKRDDSGNKTSAGQNTKNPKGSSGKTAKPREEEELFPFNLDEFVTVDEVIEEVDPSQVKQNTPKGKKKELAKNPPSSEINLKRRKGKSSVSCVAENELSFVTLDEIGEEEDAAAHLTIESNLETKALVTVDEVNDEEELNVEEMVKNANSLLTLDEIIEQDDCTSHGEPKDVTILSVDEERDLLKREPLVTVDEIGEVEELPLNESADINFAPINPKEEETAVRESIGFISSQVPEDPTTLVTVDEIQDDSSDVHLVTLDEVTEEDEESLADFNNLKEELNFVTVDEVGEEEEGENDLKIETTRKDVCLMAKTGGIKKKTIVTKQEKPKALHQIGQISEEIIEKDPKTMTERHLAEQSVSHVASPQEKGIKPETKQEHTAKTSAKRSRSKKMPSSETSDTSEQPKLEEALNTVEESGSEDAEPEKKRKKDEESSLDLDFLIPKAGFFCPICSLFYSDQKTMANHCKSARHKQNTEKFMARQKEKERKEAEEKSSR